MTKTQSISRSQDDFSAAWASIAQSMRQHNMNLRMAEAIEAHLTGEKDTIPLDDGHVTRQDKPRTQSFENVVGGRPPSEVWAQHAVENGCCEWVYGPERCSAILLAKLPDGSWLFSARDEYETEDETYSYVMFDSNRGIYYATDPK